MPDVIIVYMGTNDWADGKLSTNGDPLKEQDDTVFSVAYRIMLEKLKKNYPGAEIWCCTLAVSTCGKKQDFSFDFYYGGKHIDEVSAPLPQARMTVSLSSAALRM